MQSNEILASIIIAALIAADSARRQCVLIRYLENLACSSLVIDKCQEKKRVMSRRIRNESTKLDGDTIDPRYVERRYSRYGLFLDS
jgi:hypothetical protein